MGLIMEPKSTPKSQLTPTRGTCQQQISEHNAKLVARSGAPGNRNLSRNGFAGEAL